MSCKTFNCPWIQTKKECSFSYKRDSSGSKILYKNTSKLSSKKRQKKLVLLKVKICTATLEL